MSLQILASSRQPIREAWTRERLYRMRAIALGHALDPNSIITYTSHLQSYLTFCKLHDFAVDPTEDTLSFYAVYMSHHISPKSVNSYLSGIANQLETLFPYARTARNSKLVTRTVAGCRKMLSEGTNRKQPITPEHIKTFIRAHPTASSHNNKLFIAMLLCGFFGLHRLGEITIADTRNRRSWRKVIRRNSVKVFTDAFSYFLPGHKADRFFEGNTILFAQRDDEIDPLYYFREYLVSRDRLFSLQPSLWITEDGRHPTRSWFISRLRKSLPSDFAGQSLRSGGATFLAASGTPDDRIQAIGRWTSSAYKIYIRKNPVVLQALLHGRSLAHTRDTQF